MPRTCSVPGCKSNYYKRERFSTFCFPNDDALRSHWIKAINREGFIPSKNSAVCIKHFDPKFVKLYDTCVRPDGSVLSVKRSVPALAKDAFPTIFSDTPNHPNQMTMVPFDHHPTEKSTQNNDGIMPIADEVYIKEEILEVELEELDGPSNNVEDGITLLEDQEMDHDPLEDSDERSSKCSDTAEMTQNEEYGLLSEESSQCSEMSDKFQDKQHRLKSEEPTPQYSKNSHTNQNKDQNCDSEQPQSQCSENSDKNKDKNLYYLVLTPMNTKELICPKCTTKFTVQCSFDQHLKECKGLKKRKRTKPRKIRICTTCGRTFKTWSNLNNHQKSHSEERPYSCEICGHSFKRKADLDDHKAVHSEERPYSCDICQQSFKRKAGLVEHRAVHSDDKPYSCDSCEQSFKRKADLDDHRAVHSEEKPFLCSICALPFKRKRNLRQHERTHSSTRKIRQSQPHLCSTCGMIFKFKSSLEKHVICHSEERPHLCETCGFSFKRKRDLLHHLPTHSEERPYLCNICGLSFKVKKYLLTHLKTHSKESHT